MAWKARLARDVQAAGTDLFVQVEYYDDSNPSVVLFDRGFSFPVNWSNTDMRDAIQSRGQAARAAQARAAELAQAFPAASTVINIP